MLSALKSDGVEGTTWLQPFVADFKTRFLTLLAGSFRELAPALALSILDPKLTFSEAETQAAISAGINVLKGDGSALSPHDMKRLQVAA